jgi:hypothetical protein
MGAFLNILHLSNPLAIQGRDLRAPHLKCIVENDNIVLSIKVV